MGRNKYDCGESNHFCSSNPELLPVPSILSFHNNYRVYGVRKAVSRPGLMDKEEIRDIRFRNRENRGFPSNPGLPTGSRYFYGAST